MKLVLVYMSLVVLLGLHKKGTDAASSLEVSSGGGTVVDGALHVCPGTTVSLTCSHDSGGVTSWVVGTPIDCTVIVAHTANPSDALCGTIDNGGAFAINMVSAINQPTRTSTLVLPVNQSLNGAVVTCYAGALTSDPLVGNLTIQINIGAPSTPTVDSMEYSVGDASAGQITLLAISSGTFRTGVSFYASVVGESGSVIVTDSNITVTGLSYTGSHIVSVLATSDVCPGVLNSSVTDVTVMFNIRKLVLTPLSRFVECSNPSLPISGSWTLMEGVQSSSDPAVQLTPPLNVEPTITFTSSTRGLSGSAMFVPDSSYQLNRTVENDVYTFNVTVTNAAGPNSFVLPDLHGKVVLLSTLL